MPRNTPTRQLSLFGDDDQPINPTSVTDVADAETCLRVVLKRIRKDANLSLSDLARLTGISKGYLSSLESGKQENPSLAHIMTIASHLHVSILVGSEDL